MIFALAVPAIFISVGGAIDFSRVTQIKSELQDAADVASVGSIAVNSPAFKAGLSMSNGDIPIGATKAQSIFAANQQKMDDVSNIKVTAKVTKANTTMTSVVTASGTYKTYMLGLIGLSTLSINVTSKSIATVPPYLDFYLLLDNSPSMGLGATYADIDKLVAATVNAPTDKSCAFACHETGPFSVAHPATSPERYGLAKSLGVTMRIDVVRQATQNLMTTAKNTESLAGQYRMAIYDFGLSAESIDQQNPVPYAVSALTTDLDGSAAKAATIDLMTIPYQNYNSDRQTNFKSMLTGMNVIIPASGDGTSSAKPQQVLFFVSDGVSDAYDCSRNDGGSCRSIMPLDTTQCSAMKARGVKIAVLYTTYLPLTGKYYNSFYDDHVAGYVPPKGATDQIAGNMQACASPGLYFEVSPSQGISDAMNALFTKVISVVRINS